VSFKLLWEFIFDEQAALWSPEVSPALHVDLIVVRFVNNPYPGPFVYGYPNQTGNVMQMALCETLGAVKRVYPNNHVILIELIWK
jgi:hypothetical protein